MFEILFQLLLQLNSPLPLKSIKTIFKLSNEEIETLIYRVNDDYRFFYDENKQEIKLKDYIYLFDDKPIDDLTFSVVDIECTGSILFKDRIIEIALLKIKDGKVIESFETKVDPERRIPM